MLLFVRLLVSSVIAVAALCSSASNSTAITYNYTGNNYTLATGSYTTAMFMTVSITLPSALAANQFAVNVTSAVTSFTGHDGIQTFTEADPFSLSEIIFDTGANGNIIGWAIEFNLVSNRFMFTCTVSPSAGASSGLSLEVCGAGFSVDEATPTTSIANVIGNPGVWVAVVPEPNVALLIALGLAALGAGARAKKFHAD